MNSLKNSCGFHDDLSERWTFFFVRHSSLEDKITEQQFRDVNRRYLTNRCIGTRVSPLSSVFFRKKIGRRVWRRTPSRNDAGSPRFRTPTNLFYLLYPGWRMSTTDSYAWSFPLSSFSLSEGPCEKKKKKKRRKRERERRRNGNTERFVNQVGWLIVKPQTIFKKFRVL